MDKLPIPEAVRQALHARHFRHIVVFSGAGMSADSGIPTFRSGSNGLWQDFDPQQLATPQAWEHDKAMVWGWYEWRRGLVMAAQPNAGHLAVARLQQRHGAKVVTQNVDDLHERAGVVDALHLHGSLFAARCAACGRPHGLLQDPPPAAQLRLQPPRCADCGDHVRPGVVWFGEGLDPVVLREASRQIQACDLLLVVGTSGVVYPAAGLVDLAPATATIVEINPQPSDTHTGAVIRWQVAAAVGLPVAEEMLSASAIQGA